MNKLFNELIEKRNLDSDFLNPKYENLADPFAMPDMEKAVARIKSAIGGREKIMIYGDYDVDGVTASTVMENALTLAGVNPDSIQIMLPDRFADGYGMSPKLIKRAEKTGVTLVITVDCGSRNHDIVNELNTIGIDSIITDHHECEDSVPEAVAIVNPKRKDYTANPESLRELAGVGVAFKVAEALKVKGLIPDGQEKWLLDLVLLGTICDSMLLTGENRILGSYGLKVLEKTRRKGLKELMHRAGVKTFSSEAVGFQIGPRLNAAGRLETADIALNLLRAKDSVTAAALAEKLEELNKKRRTEQQTAMKEILDRGVSDDPVIIETGKWHEGILGIVAGHLTENYHKPSFVLTEIEGGIFKGSGRSFGDFSLADALADSKDIIISGGGHAGAAGVRVAADKLYAFRERINEYYRSLHLVDQERYFKTFSDIDVSDLSELNLELIESLRQLEPFGPGNEEPVFRVKSATVENLTRLGPDQNHLRLDIRDRHGNSFKIIAFFAPEEWFRIDTELPHDFLIKPVENEFRSVRSVEGRIVGID